MSSGDGVLLCNTDQMMQPAERTGLVRVGLVIVGLVLIGAAVAKLVWPAESVKVQAILHAPPWIWDVLVTIELFIGLLLLFGVRGPLTWIVTTLLFFAFAGFSLYLAVSGAATCGCFGQLNVNPWVTFVLDLGILGFLVRWRQQIASPVDLRLRPQIDRFTVGSIALVISLLATTAVGLSRSSASSGIDGAIGQGELVILESDEWIGKPFPLIEHIAPQIDLTEGKWTVLLYHYDCPQCREAAPLYEQMAFSSGASRRVMLLEMPPFAGETSHSSGPVVHARLSEQREWFAQTPLEIQLDHGVVVSASLDLPSVSLKP